MVWIQFLDTFSGKTKFGKLTLRIELVGLPHQLLDCHAANGAIMRPTRPQLTAVQTDPVFFTPNTSFPLDSGCPKC